MDATGAMIVPGASGDGVPRVGDPKRLARFGGGLCTALMLVSVCLGALVLFATIRTGGRGTEVLLFFAIIGTMAGFAGSWPSDQRRRVILVFAVLILMGAASFVAIDVGNTRYSRQRLMIRYSSVTRGITQAIEIYRQNNGAFPSDPQAMVDQGYIPFEYFYERNAPAPRQLTWTQLQDGWIEVGMFRIDWNEPSWLGPGSFSTNPTPVIIAAPTQNLPGTSVGFADMHVEYYSWGSWPATVQQLNADRAAAGLKPIPKAALPAVP